MKIMLLLFLLPALTTIAQTDTTTPSLKKAPSIATIHTMKGTITKGWFYKMDDDHVFLLPEGMKIPKALNDKNVDPNKASFSIQALNINTIALKKKNTGLKCTLIGMAAGATIGAILGYAGGDDPITPLGTDPLGNLIIEKANSLTSTAGEKATGGAVVGGLTGALTGAIIGSLVKKKFFIGGKKENYKNLQTELMQRLIIK